MPRQTNQDKAMVVRELWNRINTNSRQKWENINQESHNFYLDNQLTDDEVKALEKQGMPTFTINRIIPIVEMLLFYSTTRDPRWQAVGNTGDDSKIAALHTDMADYIWYINSGKAKYAQCIQDAITKSMGYLKVSIDNNRDNGMGEVTIDCLEPFDVYPDPQSRDILFRDAAFILTRKIVPKKQLMNMMPEYSAKIKKTSSVSEAKTAMAKKYVDGADIQTYDVHELASVDRDDEMFVDYIELYEKVKVPYYNVFYTIQPTQQEIEQIQGTVRSQMMGMRDEMLVQTKEQQAQLAQQLEAGEIIQERYDIEVQKLATQMEVQLQEQKDAMFQDMMQQATKEENVQMSEKEYNIAIEGELKNNITAARKFFRTKIRLSSIVGDQYLYDTILPGNEYPIIPFMYKYTGTPFPMSAVAPLVGKQKEMNKAHQLMVHNASLGSSLRWMYTDGSIDIDHWERHAAAPGALLPINSGYDPPKEVQPAQLSAAFAGIVGEGRNDMEYLAGIYSSMQGDTGQQHETYKGLLAQDEYGTRRVKAWLDNYIMPGLKHLGLIVKDYAQFLYTAEKVFRIVQPNEIEQEKEVRLNVPLYNDFGEVIELWNDYASAQFDVRVISGNTLPVNRWAYLNELKELFQMGVVDDMAVLAETDIRNKEQIVERKSILMQQQQQINQLEEQVKGMKGDNETLERMLVQSGIKDKVRQVEHDMRKKLVDSSAKVKGDQAVNKAQLDGVTKSANTALDNYKKDLARDREIQAAQTKVTPTKK